MQIFTDSQVFAEEVEPTGAVPMELSLERYRHAALPSKYPEAAEDQRLRPRVSPYLFPGSLILGQDKSHYQRVLNAWFGNPKQTWRLVYRASSHGFLATSFHRHCDGVSPTFVVVLVHENILLMFQFCICHVCRELEVKYVEDSATCHGENRKERVIIFRQKKPSFSHFTTIKNYLRPNFILLNDHSQFVIIQSELLLLFI